MVTLRKFDCQPKSLKESRSYCSLQRLPQIHLESKGGLTLLIIKVNTENILSAK